MGENVHEFIVRMTFNDNDESDVEVDPVGASKDMALRLRTVLLDWTWDHHDEYAPCDEPAWTSGN